MYRLVIYFFSSFFLFAGISEAKFSFEAKADKKISKNDLLIAKKKRKKRRVRKKYLNTEARSRAGTKTKIDFDAASIDGQRKAPVGIEITKNRADHQYDLIKLRSRWHPEMVDSAKTLETGRGR